MTKTVLESVAGRVEIIGNGGEFGPSVVAVGFACRVQIDRKRGRVRCEHSDGRVVQSFQIVTTMNRGTFGVDQAERPWIVCRCGSRRRRLYLRSDRLACRDCHQLGYESARVAHRKKRIIARIAKRVGGFGGSGEFIGAASERDLIGLLRLIRDERELEALRKSEGSNGK